MPAGFSLDKLGLGKPQERCSLDRMVSSLDRVVFPGPHGPEMHLWGLQAPAPPDFFLSLSDQPE